MTQMIIFDLARKIFYWIFPFYCISCGLEDETICQACLVKFPEPLKQACAYCRIAKDNGNTCDFCKREGALLDGLMVVSTYEKQGLLARALHNFKYNGQKEYGKALAKLMNNFLIRRGLDFEGFIICPIPLYPGKERSRGFNQSEILAKRLVAKGEVLNTLKRVSYEQAQMTLREAARVENVKGVFEYVRINSHDHYKKVLLIDDVATTLATLEEAAKTLRAAGLEEIYGLVLARENFEIETKRL